MQDPLSAAVASFAARGGHPVRDILAHGPSPFAEWAHYPEGDAEDPRTGYGWYYHAHPLSDPALAGSHGHFHLFCAPRLFGDAPPLDAPAAGTEAHRNGICHLLSLSMTMRGKPQALIAINRLADDQWIYPAAEMPRVIRNFRLGPGTPCGDVSDWLGAFLATRMDDVVQLLRDRDLAFEAARERHTGNERYPLVFVSRALD